MLRADILKNRVEIVSHFVRVAKVSVLSCWSDAYVQEELSILETLRVQQYQRLYGGSHGSTKCTYLSFAEELGGK